MSNTSKKWLAAAIALVFIGLALFLVAITANGWDLTAFGTREYETNTYTVTADFTDISIKTDTANVTFLPSEDEKCKVVAFEDVKQKHTVTVDGDALTVSITDTRAWYEYIGFSFTSPQITVYLPRTTYGALLLKTATGDLDIPMDFNFESVDVTTNTGSVRLDGVSAESVDISTSTGDIDLSSVSVAGDIKTRVSTGDMRLTDVTCKRLTSNGSTGDLYLKNVIAAEDFSIERDTGDVAFDRADAKEIRVKTRTGDVEGALLTKKLFFIHTDTGDVSVPRSESGGRCEISTDTGDIRIRIQE